MFSMVRSRWKLKFRSRLYLVSNVSSDQQTYLDLDSIVSAYRKVMDTRNIRQAPIHVPSYVTAASGLKVHKIANKNSYRELGRNVEHTKSSNAAANTDQADADRTTCFSLKKMDNEQNTQRASNVEEAYQRRQYFHPYQETEEIGREWKKCEKHPCHKGFIPIQDFTIKHLPRTVRGHAQYDFIKTMSNLTVRIRVNHISQSRPVNITADHSPGTGTGYVASVVDHPDTHTDNVDGCHFWEIYIKTAAHVVFNTEEAVLTFVDFFYDDEESQSDGRMKTLWGTDVVEANSTGDWSILRCKTDDVDLINKIKSNLFICENISFPPTQSVRMRKWTKIGTDTTLSVIMFLFSCIRFNLVMNILGRHYTVGLYSIFNVLLSWFCFALDILSGDLTKKLLIPIAPKSLKYLWAFLIILPLSLFMAYSDTILKIFYEFAALAYLAHTHDTDSLIAILKTNNLWAGLSFFICLLFFPLLFFVLNPRDCLIGTEISLVVIVFRLPETLYLPTVILIILLFAVDTFLSPRTILDLKIPILPVVSLMDAMFIVPVLLLIPCIPEILMQAYQNDFSILLSLALIAAFIVPVLPIFYNMLGRLTVVIVSHPHGKPKQVTIGRGALQFSLSHIQFLNKIIYRADTCPGSSGACVLHCYRNNVYNSNGVVHSCRLMKNDKDWNQSSMPVKSSSYRVIQNRLYHMNQIIEHGFNPVTVVY